MDQLSDDEKAKLRVIYDRMQANPGKYPERFWDTTHDLLKLPTPEAIAHLKALGRIPEDDSLPALPEG